MDLRQRRLGAAGPPARHVVLERRNAGSRTGAGEPELLRLRRERTRRRLDLRQWRLGAAEPPARHAVLERRDAGPRTSAGEFELHRLRRQRTGIGMDLRERRMVAARASCGSGVRVRRSAHTCTDARTESVAGAESDRRCLVHRLHQQRARIGLDLRQRRLAAARSSGGGSVRREQRNAGAGANADTDSNSDANAHADANTRAGTGRVLFRMPGQCSRIGMDVRQRRLAAAWPSVRRLMPEQRRRLDAHADSARA